MRVKLNRGPGNGKRFEMEREESFIRFSVPRRVSFVGQNWDDEPMVPICDIHEYVRSWRSLKDGTRIYEWIGSSSGQ